MSRIFFVALSLALLISPVIYADDNDLKLLEAASKGDLTQVQSLLANSADVNAKNRDGGTALIAAAQRGHTDTVRVLLANSADVNAKTNGGKTALMLAEEDSHPETVQLLKEAVSKK